MALFTEYTRRTFTDGLLKGLTVGVYIPRISNPAPVGTVRECAPDGCSPYREEVTRVEPYVADRDYHPVDLT